MPARDLSDWRKDMQELARTTRRRGTGMDYTFIVPHGGGWLKANKSALGGGLWVKTTETGVILPDDEIPNLVAELQHYMSQRAKERARAARK